MLALMIDLKYVICHTVNLLKGLPVLVSYFFIQKFYSTIVLYALKLNLRLLSYFAEYSADSLCLQD